nr:hypothetical protein [Leptospira santarosai]
MKAGSRYILDTTGFPFSKLGLMSKIASRFCSRLTTLELVDKPLREIFDNLFAILNNRRIFMRKFYDRILMLEFYRSSV